MPLVDYSSSSDDEISDSGRPQRSSKTHPSIPSLPPLPKDFHDLYAFAARSSVHDDPNLHSGRQRATPHIEGLWPTHIYVGWVPSQIELHRLEGILDKCDEGESSSTETQIHSLLKSELGVPLPLHISLSRSLYLRNEQREPFLQCITGEVQKLNLRQFNVKLDRLGWTSNYEGSRWFLVLHVVDTEIDGLTKLLGLSNTVARVFGQPPLYDEEANRREGGGEKPHGFMGAVAFHVSIGWISSKPIGKGPPKISDAKTHLEDVVLPVGEIKVKVGNDVTSLPLASDREAPRHGIIE